MNLYAFLVGLAIYIAAPLVALSVVLINAWVTP